MTQPDKLVVLQEDREAAADLIEYLAGGPTSSSRKMRIGQADDYGEVLVFARHRQRAMNQAAADEREANARLAEEYARVNGEICFDNVLMDPLLHGEPFTSEIVARSDDCGINSTIHSAQSHAGYHIATAIRERTT